MLGWAVSRRDAGATTFHLSYWTVDATTQRGRTFNDEMNLQSAESAEIRRSETRAIFPLV